MSLLHPPSLNVPDDSDRLIRLGCNERADKKPDQVSRLLAVEDKNATAAPPADLAIWRKDTATWWVRNDNGTAWASVAWGASSDTPIPGDFDGDGTTDFSVLRQGTPNMTWYIVKSSGGTYNFNYAVNGDIAAQADYDGDGKTDPVVSPAVDGVCPAI